MSIYFSRKGRGRALVLFHGWGFDSHIWHSLLPELKNDFDIYCIDLPGFGHTPLMAWPAFKCQLLSILPPRFAVLGWSLGGLYATRLAVEAPERISMLANVAGTPRFIHDNQWPGIEKTALDHFHQAVSTNPTEVLQQFIQLQNPGFKAFDYPVKTPDKNSLKNGLDILYDWDLRDKLNSFSKPACFMFGRLDAIVPVKTMSVMKERYPQFKYILFKKAAHMPFISHQNEFVEHLRKQLL